MSALQKWAAALKRPLPWHRRWLRREMEAKAVAAVEARTAAIDAQLARIEQIVRDASLVSDVRGSVLEQAVLRLNAREIDLRETIERRSELAMHQAMAFAANETNRSAQVVEKLSRHLPAFINATATVPALASLLRQQDAKISSLVADLEQAQEAFREADAGRQAEADDLVRQHDAKISSLVTDLEQAREALREAGANRQAETDDLWSALRTQGEDARNLWKSAELATREIGKLWQRVEFVRSEILYETKYRLQQGEADPAQSGHHSDLGPSKPEIVNPTLIDRPPDGGLKVNLGCGHVTLPGYVNVDARKLPDVDVVAGVDNLPFDPASLSELRSAHVLEHFPQEQLKRLLPYWRGLMKKGGRFVAIVPDGEAMLRAVADGTTSFATYREVLFGGQEYEGDFHFNLFTPDSLSELLTDAGFGNVEVVDRARENGQCYEFEIVAQA